MGKKFKERKLREQPNVDPWWDAWYRKAKELQVRYPTLKAEQTIVGYTNGPWEITGPYNAVSIFKDMAYAAAQRLGFRGTKELGVSFWLDHLSGTDQTLKKVERGEQDYEIVTTDAYDGRQQGWKGRQKI